MKIKTRASRPKRLTVLAVSSAAALIGLTAAPAEAHTYNLSTTGAAGAVDYSANGTWDIYARDTLTDGHCARFQVKDWDDTSWRWYDDMVCTSTEQWVSIVQSGWSVRICRTGIGNCSAALKL
ncbi:hypothetical protein ABZY05_41940 [Streptomyces canus]|uniref:hypothetical protein n=1 Tax=Streptomyces canus TaxID=58343 RepID=UPI0033A2C2A4